MKLLGAIVVLTYLFALCSATGTCNVRFINACSSSSGQISLNIGSISIPSISLGAISAYVQIPVGTVTLSVLGPDGNLVSLNANLLGDTFYTVALVGDQKLSLKIFIDSVAVDVNVPLLRVILLGNLNVDLNVFLDVNLLGILKANADISTSLSFQKIIAGNVTVAIKNLLGLNIAAKLLVALPGNAYTCYLIPSISANAIVDVVLANDVAVTIQAKVNLRLLHAFVPLLGNLDLVVNGAVVLPGVSYGSVLAYVSVNAGVLNIKVCLAGTTNVLVELKTANLIAGNSYTLCLFGESKPFVKLLLDTVLSAPTNLLVRVVHLAESLLLPQVVSLVNQPLLSLIPNPLKFQDITNFIPLTVNVNLPLTLTIATTLDLQLAQLNLVAQIGDGSTVCIIGSKYSSTRGLQLISLNNTPISVYIDTSLATVNLNLNLLGLTVNANILGLIGLYLNL